MTVSATSADFQNMTKLRHGALNKTKFNSIRSLIRRYNIKTIVYYSKLLRSITLSEDSVDLHMCVCVQRAETSPTYRRENFLSKDGESSFDRFLFLYPTVFRCFSLEKEPRFRAVAAKEERE